MDAIQINDIVFLLHKQGLQRINIIDGSSSYLLEFNKPAIGGILSSGGNQSYIFYGATFDEPRAEFGLGTQVGVFRVDGNPVQPELYYTKTKHVLGLTANKSGIYLQLQGQDPAFGFIEIVDLNSGEIVSTLPISGYGLAQLSPNSHYLITTGEKGDVNIYNLASEHLDPRVISLPNQPSYVWRSFWSPDSQKLYIVPISGHIGGNDLSSPLMSHGLWQLDVETSILFQVASGVDNQEPWVSTDSRCKWLLLRYSNEAIANLLNLESGSIKNIPLTPSAIPRSDEWHHQPISSISSDGHWLLLRQVKKDKSDWEPAVTIINLVNKQGQIVPIPDKAVLLGWR